MLHLHDVGRGAAVTKQRVALRPNPMLAASVGFIAQRALGHRRNLRRSATPKLIRHYLAFCVNYETPIRALLSPYLGYRRFAATSTQGKAAI
jgi:hypothetical protein